MDIQAFIHRYTLFFCFLALTPLGYSQEAAPKKSIIVLDGSGSMWGKVGNGEVKIDIAKRVVADLLPTVPGETELGLMAYGHRRKGDCTDIELMVPPATGNRDAIGSAVRDLIPRGKTPLCDAVMMAADALKFEKDRATVILVSDGIETCGRDPAAVGQELAKRGIDFVCHVVAFDIEKDKNAGLDALASQTGGLYLEAKDAASLQGALKQAVETVAAPPTSLIISGENADGELLAGVRFEIRAGKAEGGDPIQLGTGGKYRQVLEPGEYHVTGTFGELKATSVVTVPAAKKTEAVLTFEAIGLSASAALTEEGEDLERGLGWKVYDQPDSDQSRQPITYSYEARPTFHLPPGDYHLQARYGRSTVEKAVSVLQEKATKIRIIFGSGTLVAQARMSETDPPIEKGLSWKLYAGEADVEGDRELVTYSYLGKTNLVVPSGSYLLQVGYGNSATQKMVEIKPGESTEVLLTFGAGTLVAQAVMAEGADFAKGKLRWKLLSKEGEDGKREQVGFGYKDLMQFKVPSGEYLLTLQRGSATTEEEVLVAAGETNEVVLNLNAGIWKAEAYMAESSSEATTDSSVGWKVYAKRGNEGEEKQVAFSFQTAEYFLAAGNYIAKIKRGAANVEKAFAVLPNQTTEDKIILNAGTLRTDGPEGRGGFKAWVRRANDANTVGNLGYSYKPKATFYLSAGDYVFHWRHKVDGKNQEKMKTVTVEAGKLHDLRLE